MARLNTRPSTVRGSRAGTSVSPSPTTSGQENRDPAMRRDKGKERASMASRTSLPTPSSDGSGASRGQKRKRTHAQASATQEADVPEDQDPDDAKFTRYYDPNQDAEKRRQVKRKSRAMIRDIHGMSRIQYVSKGVLTCLYREPRGVAERYWRWPQAETR